MTKLHPAYLAGLFDGEGSVGLYPVKNGRKDHPSGEKIYWGLKVSLSGCHKEMIGKVHESFGVGSFGAMKRQKLYVRIGVDHSRRNEVGKQCWRWLLSDRKKALTVFEIIRPYLIEKAEQVDVAAAFCKGELDGPEAARRLREFKQT